MPHPYEIQNTQVHFIGHY